MCRGTYFFTVNTYRRQRFFPMPMSARPCGKDRNASSDPSVVIEAWVLLPPWTSPPGDEDFSHRNGADFGE